MLNDNFKYPVINTLKTLEAPAFEEPLDESAENVSDYFKRIQDYIISFDMKELDDYSSDELYKASRALMDLYEMSHEMTMTIAAFQDKIENLSYDREDEESERAEEERITAEHNSYMQNWFNSTRM